jgi:hypothetical protein
LLFFGQGCDSFSSKKLKPVISAPEPKDEEKASPDEDRTVRNDNITGRISEKTSPDPRPQEESEGLPGYLLMCGVQDSTPDLILLGCKVTGEKGEPIDLNREFKSYEFQLTNNTPAPAAEDGRRSNWHTLFRIESQENASAIQLAKDTRVTLHFIRQASSTSETLSKSLPSALICPNTIEGSGQDQTCKEIKGEIKTDTDPADPAPKTDPEKVGTTNRPPSPTPPPNNTNPKGFLVNDYCNQADVNYILGREAYLQAVCDQGGIFVSNIPGLIYASTSGCEGYCR